MSNMSKTVHNKLVRDRIPEIIERNGETAKFRILRNRDEFVEALMSKLSEETREVLDAVLSGLSSDVVKEVADVREVLDAIVAEFGAGPEATASVQEERRSAR